MSSLLPIFTPKQLPLMAKKVCIVPPDLGVLSSTEVTDELAKRYDTRTRTQAPRSAVKDNRIRKRIAACLALKHRRFIGFEELPEARRAPVVRLAREGADLFGPNDPHQVDELFATLHDQSPWMSELSTYLMRHLRARLDAGQPGLKIPPLLLVGSPGCGKSQYALSLANLANVVWRRIDVGSGSAGFRIVGTERGWGSAGAGIPVQTVCETGSANPLFIVDEVDKSGTIYSQSGTSTSLVTSLLEMLEPATAAQFECPYFRIPFDLPHANWVLTANDISTVPAPLKDRCRVFAIPDPSTADLLHVFDQLSAPIEDRDLISEARETLATTIAEKSISLRQISALVDGLRGYGTTPEYH